MPSRQYVHVKIGEVKIGTDSDILKATLGSCVGIGFIWKEQKICGLAHCLLPIADRKTNQISAKFVDWAIHSLMALMKIKKEDISQIEVHLAGGGNILKQLSQNNPEHIGKKNVESAIRLLNENGFKIFKEDTGGDHGRQMKIDCSTRTVEVSILLAHQSKTA